MRFKTKVGAVLPPIIFLLGGTAFGVTGNGRWVQESVRNAVTRLDVYDYVPPVPPSGRYEGLILALHGCHETAQDFATISRLPQLADENNLILVMPQQSAQDNPDRCWNWFLPINQARLTGEPVLMMAAVKQVLGQYSVDRSKLYVVGMSAGAVMANVMASAYPDVFTGAAIHSGIEYGDPLTMQDALDGHMRCPVLEASSSGDLAYASSGLVPERLPKVIIFYGDQDERVYPCNSQSLVAQWWQMKILASRGLLSVFDLSKLAVVSQHAMPGKDSYTQTDWQTTDGWAMREVMVKGMAHAWSGGTAGFANSNPNGPDATTMLWRFLNE